MPGPPTDRRGYVHGGVLTEFRDEGGVVLWESAMVMEVGENWRLWYAIGGGALVEYEVVGQGAEFREAVTHPEPPDPPGEIEDALCWCLPYLVVRAV